MSNTTRTDIARTVNFGHDHYGWEEITVDFNGRAFVACDNRNPIHVIGDLAALKLYRRGVEESATEDEASIGCSVHVTIAADKAMRAAK